MYHIWIFLFAFPNFPKMNSQILHFSLLFSPRTPAEDAAASLCHLPPATCLTRTSTLPFALGFPQLLRRPAGVMFHTWLKLALGSPMVSRILTYINPGEMIPERMLGAKVQSSQGELWKRQESRLAALPFPPQALFSSSLSSTMIKAGLSYTS